MNKTSFLILLNILGFMLNPTFAATERVSYNGQRNELEVFLAEDYFQNIVIREQIPVTRTFCQDIPVTQNVCQQYPAQQVCGSSPVCHPTPYGPRCIPVYGCQVIPPRQVCGPVTTMQRSCGQQTVLETVTRTERRYMYRSEADLTFLFAPITSGEDRIEFDVHLNDDQISFDTDFGADILFVDTITQNDSGRGKFNRSYRISKMTRDDFLRPVSEIPELLSYYRGMMKIEIGQTQSLNDIDVQLRLKHRETGHEYIHQVNYAQLLDAENHSELIISLAREIGPNWRHWENRLYWVDITISRRINRSIINRDILESAFVSNRFYF